MNRFIHRPKNTILFVGILILLLLCTVSIVIPRFYPHDWFQIDKTQALRAPSSENILGTNAFGQDIFSGLLLGIRTSLIMAIIGVIPYTLIGSCFGMISGYSNSRMKIVIDFIMTIFLSIPVLPLIFLLSFVLMTMKLSNDMIFYSSILLYSLFSAPTLYKIIRAETAKLNSEEFMRACEITGIRKINILKNHLLPNLIGQILVSSVLFISQLIIIELMLYFFGITLSFRHAPSLGSLIPNIAGNNKFREFYWIWFYPILAVSLITISLKLISEGLRLSFDPKAQSMK